MSYDFYSLVSSIKDKSSQAMATLSSDLKEFTTIMQEDVAEVAKNVRKTVHEKSEALRQRSDQQAEHAALSDEEEKKEEEGEDHDEKDSNAETNTSAMALPSISGINMFSFSNLSLESVGSKLLHTADELLGTLAGSAHLDEDIEHVSFESQTEEEKLETARRYRLLALQEDSETYLEAPMDTETFAKWRDSVSTDEFASIQQEVLAHYPTVAAKLDELVPASVTADDFWAHYIYKASLLAAQEQRGADLLEQALNDNEEEVGWDVESPRQDLGDQDFEEDKAEVVAEAKRSSATRHGALSPVDSESGPSNASSDGDSSWIELDEQRREAAASAQAPLSSSSSTASSFVPLDGVGAAVAPSTAPLDEIEDEDEALDWGDEDDKDAKQDSATTNANANANANADGKPENEESAPARKGGDWGEWD